MCNAAIAGAVQTFLTSPHLLESLKRACAREKFDNVVVFVVQRKEFNSSDFVNSFQSIFINGLQKDKLLVVKLHDLVDISISTRFLRELTRGYLI